MTTPREALYVIGCSWGNDSLAAAQFLKEQGINNAICLFNDTGWSMPKRGNHESWLDRVARLEAWAVSVGFGVARTNSVGMEALVRQRKAWPRQGMQFCTEELKIKPTIKWLEVNDPDRRAVFVNGKRRAESINRSKTVEWIEDSTSHGGRRLWQPLYLHDEKMRDALIIRAGHDVLPHKSKECMVCVNENRKGLRETPEVAIVTIERIENSIPPSKKTGKHKTMFRPASKMGACGIREVVEWARSDPGRYNPNQYDLLAAINGPSDTDTGCDAGYCAS